MGNIGEQKEKEQKRNPGEGEENNEGIVTPLSLVETRTTNNKTILVRILLRQRDTMTKATLRHLT